MRRTGPDQRIRDLVLARADAYGSPRCERCGAKPPQHMHHRKPRGRGGSSDPGINSPANLTAICAGCHDGIETHRSNAYRTGWLVYRQHDPAATPLTYRGSLALLDPHGTVTTVEQ